MPWVLENTFNGDLEILEYNNLSQYTLIKKINVDTPQPYVVVNNLSLSTGTWDSGLYFSDEDTARDAYFVHCLQEISDEKLVKYEAYIHCEKLERGDDCIELDVDEDLSR